MQIEQVRHIMTGPVRKRCSMASASTELAGRTTEPTSHRTRHAQSDRSGNFRDDERNRPAGIAAAMLYLNERNALLEALRVDVVRYVRSGRMSGCEQHSVDSELAILF